MPNRNLVNLNHKFKTPDGKIYYTHAKKLSSTKNVKRFQFSAKQKGGNKEYSLVVNFDNAVWKEIKDNYLQYGANIIEGFILKKNFPDEATVNPANISEYKKINDIEDDKARILIQLYKTETHPFNFRKPPLSLRLLAEYLKWTGPKIFRLCEELVKEKLIKSIEPPNSNLRFYRLTKEGRRIVESVYQN